MNTQEVVKAFRDTSKDPQWVDPPQDKGNGIEFTKGSLACAFIFIIGVLVLALGTPKPM